MPALEENTIAALADRALVCLAGIPVSSAVEALRDSNLWDDIRRAAVDAAIDMGEAVSKAYHDEQIGELEAEVSKVEENYVLFELDSDRLQEMIVDGRVDDALHTLREMLPDHQFLSIAAQKMLNGIRQGTLFPAEVLPA